ncbi:glucosidase II [Spiromyces aspiralis]|uniref:Glucosidase II n=1 Tax=Spiromyces aspiralis TaxID=68401 RepID=A0ACC1I1M3_9FUNG|nr:glucosidase II [Spiromyces aspiralis]
MPRAEGSGDERAPLSVDVRLPGGVVWYDLFTNERLEGGQSVAREVGLADTPVYVRGGSVVPTRERQRRSSTLMRGDPYTLHVYLDGEGSASGDLYVDDGESFDYERGGYVHRIFRFAGTVLESVPAPNPNSNPDSAVRKAYEESARKLRVERIVVAGLRQAAQPVTKARVTVGGGQPLLVDVEYDANINAHVVRDPAVSIVDSWRIELLA